MSQIKIKPSSLEDLLKEDLIIPPYQRPYSWTVDQVKPLLDDLFNRKDDDLLIMGGIILHEKDGKFYIVDGQQRLITYSIIKYIFDETECKSKLLNQKFIHSESVKNIMKNAQFIKIYEKKKSKLNLQNIHFIVVTTQELDDAFAFFDSQNTRGKSLEDYDVLKAHHLRFIEDDILATECAKDWERIEKLKQQEKSTIGLGLLLETYLARGRKWSNNVHRQPIIRDEFKSQRKSKKDAKSYLLNKYQQAALFSSWEYHPTKENVLKFKFEEIDATYKIGGIEIHKNFNQFFPFQIAQTIEGGELFFWYTQKYYALTENVFSLDNEKTSKEFRSLIEGLELFNYNTGCTYVKDVFKATLIFYIDKFGYEKLDEIAKCFFFSIYWLRLKQATVQYSSVYKYIREEFNPFSLIKEASFPEFIIDMCNEYIEDKSNFEANNYSGIRCNLIEEIIKHPEYFSLINLNNASFKNIKNV
jgi:6-pyruvoyl-tetrahydropterin synthase